MDLIKTYIFILLTSLICSSCQTNTADTTTIDKVEANSVINTQDTLEIDSTEITVEIEREDSINIDTIQRETIIKETKTTAKKIKIDTLTIETIDANDVWLGDPFEDPNYVGTPCVEDENGNCIVHKHH